MSKQTERQLRARILELNLPKPIRTGLLAALERPTHRGRVIANPSEPAPLSYSRLKVVAAILSEPHRQ